MLPPCLAYYGGTDLSDSPFPKNLIVLRYSWSHPFNVGLYVYRSETLMTPPQGISFRSTNLDVILIQLVSLSCAVSPLTDLPYLRFAVPETQHRN